MILWESILTNTEDCRGLGDVLGRGNLAGGLVDDIRVQDIQERLFENDSVRSRDVVHKRKQHTRLFGLNWYPYKDPQKLTICSCKVFYRSVLP